MKAVLQHLNSSNRGAILELLRGSSLPGYAGPQVIAIDAGDIGGGSGPTSLTAQWMAGAYCAEDLTGFVQARDGSFDGRSFDSQVQTMLFVDERWRRQGIGTLLLKAAMDWASQRQASTLRLVCARTDWPMRYFAGKFAARLDLVLGQIVAEIPLGQPAAPTRMAAPSEQER